MDVPRCGLKIDPSSGSFPAIWTCGNNKEWPLNGEIDIMEFYIHNGEQSLTSNFAAGKKTAMGGYLELVMDTSFLL